MTNIIQELDFEDKTPVNVTESAKNISDRYEEGILDGLQNETIQNSVDGFEKNQKEGNIDKGKNLRIELVYDPKERKFEWRDNAGGMSEEILRDYFLSLSFKEKVPGTFRGSRGEGAGVFMELGEYVGVETLHLGQRSTGAWNCRNGKRDFNWSSNKLDINGTLVEVYNVKDRYADKLEDIDRFEKLVRRWWHKILERNDVEITYEVKGEEKRHITPLDLSGAEKLVRRNLKTEDGINVEKLEIFIFEDERPAEFKRTLGVNIHEHTIDWTTPQGIPSHKRIVAFAEVPDLYEHEKPSHRGFRSNRVTRNARARIREAITEVAEREIEEVEEITQDMQSELEKMIDLYNQWVGENSEVFNFLDSTERKHSDSQDKSQGEAEEEGRGNSQVGEPDTANKHTEKDSESEEEEMPHISLLSPGKRDFKRGDTVRLTTYLKNPIRTTYENCSLSIALINPSGDQVDNIRETGIELQSNQERQPKKEFKFDIPEDAEKGRYVVKGVLKSDKGYSSKSEWFRVEVDPQEWKSNVPTGGLGLDEAKLAEFDEDREPVDRDQAYLDLEGGRILINMEHPSYDRALDRDELAFYSFRCAVIEAIKYRISTVIEQSKQIRNSEEVKEQMGSMLDLISNGNAFIAQSEL